MPVLVDTDPAMGISMRDVDDGLAVWLLHRAQARGEGPIVAGLSTVFGNGPLARTHLVATDLGRRWNIPVHRGAVAPGDAATPAVDALVAHSGTVLAIGPQTNIAAAIERGARWERLILLGGTDRGFPNIRPLHTTELNFALDEPAAEVALARADVLVPMEVCRKVLFRAEDFAVLPDWMQAACASWLRIGPLMTGRMGVHPWDVLAAMFLVRPGLFRTEARTVRLASSLGRAGYVAFGEASTGRTVDVLVDVDVTGFHAAWREIAG